MYLPASTAIAVAKENWGKKHTYENDEVALGDFMVVHWAYECPDPVHMKYCLEYIKEYALKSPASNMHLVAKEGLGE
jgi:hypothetical protein